jgi:hypothetical protein
MKPCNYLCLKIGLVVLCLALTACGLPTSTPASTEAAPWRLVGVGDCPGLDEGETTPGSIPDDARAKAGYTAVCWDGETYTNKFHGGSAFCTYKRISYDRCLGGENPGEMYTTDPR